MPNFWGCRCCQNNRPIYLRFLNRDGIEQWVWRDFALAEAGRFNKPAGFSLGPDGRIAFAGGSYSDKFGLISTVGQTVFSGSVAASASALQGAYHSCSDADGNVYFLAGKDYLGYPTNRFMSYDSSGTMRFQVPLTSSGPDVRELHLSGTTIYIFEIIGSTSRLNVFDTDGNLIGYQDFTAADDKAVLNGIFGINAAGNASFVLKKHSTNDHARLCEVDSTASVVDLHDIDPGVGLLSQCGYGVLSDGTFVLATRQLYTPATIADNQPLVYDLTNDAVLFTLRPSGTLFYPTNCQFDGDGFFYYVKCDTSGVGDTIYCLDESGAEIWRYQETASTPILACSPDGVLIGTHDLRPRNGGILTVA